MNRQEQEQAIGKDLSLCDLIDAIGKPSAKRKAKAHRKACMDQIKAWNIEEGNTVSIDDLFAELSEFAEASA
jgi:hypothetical protein